MKSLPGSRCQEARNEMSKILAGLLPTSSLYLADMAGRAAATGCAAEGQLAQAWERVVCHLAVRKQLS